MNGSQNTSMSDYVRAVRRRWWVVLLLTVAVTGVALGVSLSATPQYDATTKLLFKPEDRIEQLLDPAGAPDVDPERELNTGVELIKLDVIAEAVRRELSLQISTEDLLERVSTDFTTDSDIVSVTVRDTDAARAAAIANSFANEYIEYRKRAATETLQRAAAIAKSEYEALLPSDRESTVGRELQARRRQLEITAALQTGGVEVVRRAVAPEDPSRPRPKLSGALGLMLGLGLGFVAALMLEFTDRRLRREEEVEEFFGMPILASIPPPRRRSGDDHIQREAFGLLAASLRFALPEGDSHVVMVTSPGAAEGKTSVTLGLARALTRLGLRVIAIEADLRRPTFSQHAPLGTSSGVTGLLVRPGPIAPELVWLDASTMEPVTAENLQDGLAFAVLPAGEVPPHPQRLLARPAMRNIAEQARSLADVVLIDTPPIGSVNDAITLARFVDSVVVIARLDRTTKDVARRALRSLNGLNADMAGIVITNAAEMDEDSYYGDAMEQTGRTRDEVVQG